MTVLSILRNFAGLGLRSESVLHVKSSPICRGLSTSITRFGGGGDYHKLGHGLGHGPSHMVITPSKFQWQRYKDVLHFYILLGVIPAMAVVFYANIFIGPAKLAEVPEGYEPKYWEYYKHPISRFIARYITSSYQEDYERNLHYIVEEAEKMRMRKLSQRVEKLMQERGDYPNYYTAPIIVGKYMRSSKEESDMIHERRGND